MVLDLICSRRSRHAVWRCVTAHWLREFYAVSRLIDSLCHGWLTTCVLRCVTTDWLRVFYVVSPLTDYVCFTPCHRWLTVCILHRVTTDYVCFTPCHHWLTNYVLRCVTTDLTTCVLHCVTTNWLHVFYTVSRLSKWRRVLYDVSRLTDYTSLSCVVDDVGQLTEANRQLEDRVREMEGWSRFVFLGFTLYISVDLTPPPHLLLTCVQACIYCIIKCLCWQL